MKPPVPAILALAALCLPLHGKASEPAPPLGSFDLATDTMGALRDDEHKKRGHIRWPTEASIGVLAEGAEAYLIEGYISFTCTRFVWTNDEVHAQQVRMTRSWTYCPEESFVSKEFRVTPERFRQAWQAAMLVEGATVEVTPLPGQSKLLTGGSFTRGSHDATYFALIRPPGKPPVEFLTRGSSKPNGIRQFDELQTLAVTRIFKDLVPADPECHPFDLKDWGPFLTQILQKRVFSSDLQSQNSQLLVETSLRLLGQMGYSPALPVIQSLSAAAQAQANVLAQKEPHRAQSIRLLADRMVTEAVYATEKILLQDRFDPKDARQIIANWSRRLSSDRDFIQWVRRKYLEQDRSGYQKLLASHLADPSSRQELLRESIASLRKEFPKDGSKLLAGLLTHRNSEVASDAALALLALEPGNQSAIQALDRLASDPAAPIPDSAMWSTYFGRERALDALYSTGSPVPPEYRWDAARVRRQLAVPAEDGRMVNRLLTALYILDKKEVARDEQIAAYRQSLSGKFPAGVECARKALNDLGAKD